MEENNILKTIFGETKFSDVNILLNNISKIDNNLNYEFEMRFIDESYHSKLDSYNFISNESIIEKDYTDEIIITYKSDILANDSYVKFRSIKDSNILERKLLISKIEPQNSYVDKQLLIKFSLEQQSKINNMNIDNYQRKQRISYIFKDKNLKNWRIDKTVRFITTDINSMKLKYPLTKENVEKPKYYDILDVEFEYIGEFNEIRTSIFYLFEFIYPEHFRKINKVYNKINLLYNIELLDVFPNVSIITNDIISSISLDKFVYMEKYDGERRALIVFDDNLYELTKTYFKLINSKKIIKNKSQLKTVLDSFNKSKQPKYNLIILDCEYYDNCYNIFDVLYYCDNDLNKLIFTERISYADKVVEYINCLCDLNIKVINYYDGKNKNWNELIDFINNNEFNSNNIPIDGLIFRINNSSFINAKIFKLKNKQLSTIDFKLMWVNSKQLYYLYLIGDPANIVKKLPFLNKHSKEHFSYSVIEKNTTKNIYILFSTPYKEKMYYFLPRINWNKTNYSQNNINKINTLMKDIYFNPLKYHNTIVEMSWAIDGWVPLKTRFDKTFSNNYKVGMSIVSLLYDNYHYDNKFNNNLLLFTESIKTLYLNTILLMNRFILEKHLNKFNNANIFYLFNNESLLTDIFKYIDIDSLYIMHSKKYKLIHFIEKAQNVKQTMNNDVLLQKTKINQFKNININCIHSNFSNNNDNILNKLLSKMFYNPNSIDIILIEKFYKICNSYTNIIEFRNFVLSIISKNGIIIITYFNGDNILDNNNYKTFNKIKKVDNNTDLNVKSNVVNIKHLRKINEIVFIEKLIEKKFTSNSYFKTFIGKRNKNKLLITQIDFDYELKYKYNNYFIYIVIASRYDTNKEFLINKLKNLFENNFNVEMFYKYSLPNMNKNKYSDENLVLREYFTLLENDFVIKNNNNLLTNQYITKNIKTNNYYQRIDVIEDYLGLYSCCVLCKK